MLFDRKGQTYTEYIVILAAVLVIAVIVMGVIYAIGQVYQRKQSEIEALP